MRKETVDNTNAPLDLDTILGSFSNYPIKAEYFPYETNAFLNQNDNKDNISVHQQSQTNNLQSQLSGVTTTILDSNGNNTGINGEQTSSVPTHSSDWPITESTSQQVGYY